MSSMYSHCTTISSKTQAMYDRENRKMRAIAAAYGAIFPNKGGKIEVKNTKKYAEWLRRTERNLSNARNSLSANRAAQTGQHKNKISHVATSSTLSVAAPETVSADTNEDDDGGGGGDSDPDQPDQPRFTHLTPFILPQRNRSLLSWQSAPGSCSMVRGGRA